MHGMHGMQRQYTCISSPAEDQSVTHGATRNWRRMANGMLFRLGENLSLGSITCVLALSWWYAEKVTQA